VLKELNNHRAGTSVPHESNRQVEFFDEMRPSSSPFYRCPGRKVSGMFPVGGCVSTQGNVAAPIFFRKAQECGSWPHLRVRRTSCRLAPDNARSCPHFSVSVRRTHFILAVKNFQISQCCCQLRCANTRMLSLSPLSNMFGRRIGRRPLGVPCRS